MHSAGINPALLLMEVLAGAQGKIGQEISKSGFSLQLSEQHQLIQNTSSEQSGSILEQPIPASISATGLKQPPSPQSPGSEAQIFGRSNNSISKAKISSLSSINAKDLALSKWKKAQELTFADPLALDQVLTQLHLTPSVRASIKDALNEQGQISLLSLTKVLDRVAPSNRDLLPDGKATTDDIQTLLAGVLQQQGFSLPNLKELGIRLTGSYNFSEFRDLLRHLVDRSAKGSPANPSSSPLHQTSETISSCGKQSTDASSIPRSRLPNQTHSFTANLIPSFLKEEQEPARDAQKPTRGASPTALSCDGAGKVCAPAGEQPGQKERLVNDRGLNQVNEAANRPKAEANSGNSVSEVLTGPGLLSRPQRPSFEGVQGAQSQVLSPGASETRTPPTHALPSFRIAENNITLGAVSPHGPSEVETGRPLQSPARVTANAAVSGELVGRGLRLIPIENDLNLRTKSVEASTPGRISMPMVEKTAAPGTMASTSNQPNSSHEDSFPFNSTKTSSHQFTRLPSPGAATASPGDGQSSPWEKAQVIFRDVIRLQMATSSHSDSWDPVSTELVPEQQGRLQSPTEKRSPEAAIIASQGKTPFPAVTGHEPAYRLNITNSADVAELALPGEEILPGSTFQSSSTNPGYSPNLTPATAFGSRYGAGVTPVDEGLWPTELLKSNGRSTTMMSESTSKVLNDGINEFEVVPQDLTNDQSGKDVLIKDRRAGNQQYLEEAISSEKTKDMAAAPEVHKGSTKSSAAGSAENLIRAASELQNKNSAQIGSEKPSVTAQRSGTASNGSVQAPFRQESRSAEAAELSPSLKEVMPGSTFRSSLTNPGQGLNLTPAAALGPRYEAGQARVEPVSWPTEPLKATVQSTSMVREGISKVLNEGINELEPVPQDLINDQSRKDVLIKDRHAGSQQYLEEAQYPEKTKDATAPADAQKPAKPSLAGRPPESLIRAGYDMENKNIRQTISGEPLITAAPDGVDNKSNVQASFNQETLLVGAIPDFQKSAELLAGRETASKAAPLKSALVPKEVVDQAAQTNPMESCPSKATSDKGLEKVTPGTHTPNQFARQEQNRDHDTNLLFQRDGIQMPSVAATSADQKGMEAFSSYITSLPVELALRIRDLHLQKRNQLTLELEPEHLGRLLVRIDTDANQVKAFISTESSQVRELLSRSTAQLRQELASQGLVLDQLQIDVNSQAAARDQHFHKHDPGNRTSSWNQQPAGTDEESVKPILRKPQIGSADILISLFV